MTQDIDGYTQKIDDLATLGLLGVNNSLAYRIHELERHFHHDEIWFGATATEDSLSPYTLVSGNNDFGAAVQLLQPSDTPFVVGMVRFDFHKIEVVDVDTASPYYIRIIWGSGTVGDAETARQYTTFPVTPTGIGANVSGAPVPFGCRRAVSGTDNVWAKCKNVTNLAEVDILCGIHEYQG